MIFNVKDSLGFKKSKNFAIQQNPQTIPLILKKLKIFDIQRKLRVAAAVGMWYNNFTKMMFASGVNTLATSLKTASVQQRE